MRFHRPSGMLGSTVMGLGQALPVWAAGSFLETFMSPIINSSNQAIWQAKVAPDLQGRVFATRRLIAWFVTPIATLLAGPLADYALEPAMQYRNIFSISFAWLVGIGPGAGMSVILIGCGLAMAAVGVGGYLFRAVREAKALLPDHEVAARGEVESNDRLQELLEERQRLIAGPATPERERALREIAGELRELGRQRALAD